ncbi:MAG: putative glycosyltransferase [Chloroflexi bacterium OLB13]|nr:MAG: putative glycosyltransferase [Chloroflexi bacterium OLB13]
MTERPSHRPLRVLMISKACVVGIYQKKLEDIARLGIDLTVAVPPAWRDERGEQALERVYVGGYDLRVLPIRFNGNFHLHVYRGLGRLFADLKPDLVHIDEEPYNAATWQAIWHARRIGAKVVIFSWQNLLRHYPPPFSWGERWALARCDLLIAGTDSAADVWRAKGYSGPIRTIPQFGTDPELFRPKPEPRTADHPFVIGYFGRLVVEKGVHVLLDALAQLTGAWRALIVGGGPELDRLKAMAASLHIADRVEFRPQVPSTEMPRLYHSIDVLALPSLTRPNWKEQFGRVLVEAMASGVPVIGADSGAIPSVVGDGGIIVPEGSVSALRDAIQSLIDLPERGQQLAEKGRMRVIEHFTQQSVARETVLAYRALYRDTADERV